MDSSGNQVEEMINNCMKNGIANINKKLNMVITQTNYTKIQAIKKLIEFEYDEISVIKDYMGINKYNSSQPDDLSTQQKIYKSFRDFF